MKTMYIKEIISLLSWPVLILIIYYVTVRLIKKYETKTETEKQE